MSTKKIGSDPFNKNDASAPKIYVYETVDVEYQDSGANDEGYFYNWCECCYKRTEHDDSGCISCYESDY